MQSQGCSAAGSAGFPLPLPCSLPRSVPCLSAGQQACSAWLGRLPAPRLPLRLTAVYLLVSPMLSVTVQSIPQDLVGGRSTTFGASEAC